MGDSNSDHSCAGPAPRFCYVGSVELLNQAPGWTVVSSQVDYTYVNTDGDVQPAQVVVGRHEDGAVLELHTRRRGFVWEIYAGVLTRPDKTGALLSAAEIRKLLGG